MYFRGFFVRLSSLVFLVILITSSSLAVHAQHQAKPISKHTTYPPSSSPASLTDYWNGTAKWEFQRKFSSNISAEGASLHAVGSTWYLFTREYGAGGSPTNACPAGHGTTYIWKSTNQGASWNSPRKLLEIYPSAIDTQNPVPWGCWATDGDAYYNASTQTWHYLFQCMANDGKGVWNGCHITVTGSDPTTGTLGSPWPNPVIHRGDLWNNICIQGRDCYIPDPQDRVSEEGTFDIFGFAHGYYFVNFHGVGYPPTSTGQRIPYSYRGIAVTPDFRTWYTGNNPPPGMDLGLPTSAVLSVNDVITSGPQRWAEEWDGSTGAPAGGPIGPASGGIFADATNGMYYFSAEFYSITIDCAYQISNTALFRAPTLNTKPWQQFPKRNPIMYSATDETYCNLRYSRFFQDANGYMYLLVGRPDTRTGVASIYFYKLVPNTNILTNGDIWRAAYAGMPYEGWAKINPATNLTSYRIPQKSNDGNQFLEMNCGNISLPCSGVYQDANVSQLRGKKYRYGGCFRTASGTGKITMSVWQFTASGPTSTSKTFNVDSNRYHCISSDTEYSIGSSTSTLRYEIYLHDRDINFRADNMYINITN